LNNDNYYSTNIEQFDEIVKKFRLKTNKYGVAINGQVLRYLYENRKKHGFETVLRKVLDSCKVYASLSPDDKALLVQLL
jgi:magnesium-transporting ATPase (P-type)